MVKNQGKVRAKRRRKYDRKKDREEFDKFGTTKVNKQQEEIKVFLNT